MIRRETEKNIPLNKTRSIKCAIVSTIFAMLISTIYIKGLVDNEIKKNKTEALFILENQAQKIRNDLLFTMEQIYQFRSLVYGAKCLDVDPTPVIDRILKNPVVRNVLYAPGGIVEKVFPYRGNEGVIGLNLLGNKNKSNRGAITALQSNKLILSGPYELKQGGRAFSGRISLINASEEKGSQPQGLVSITVNFPDVIEKSTSGLLKKLNYDFTLLKKDVNSGGYLPILSNMFKEREGVVTTFFKISNIELCLQAAPRNGWFNRSVVSTRIILFLFASITIGMAIGLLINARQKLVNKAMCDPLTGIFNRAGATSAIMKLQKASRYKYGAVAIIDLDNLKDVNDVLGHQTGDKLLCKTATILRETLRDTDIVSRLGGDEFMLYLPFDGDKTFIVKKMEKIRKKLMQTMNLENKLVEVSSSIGVTLFQVDSKEITDFYKEADEALYISKKTGKNRVTFYK